MAQIHEKIMQVMKDCGAIAKDELNPQQRYKYRGIDAVMNALNPAMRKNKIFVVPEVLELNREERESAKGNVLIYSTVKVKYTFYAEDGSFLDCVTLGEGMDSGDKSINKAMSAAFKYACFQVFCIPTEEMHDSEEDSPEVKAATIGETRAAALAQFLKDNGISEDYIKHSLKVSALKDISEKHHAYIIKNASTLKEKSDNWKGAKA